MFLKISCERSTPHSEDGIYIVQVCVLLLCKINSQLFCLWIEACNKWGAGLKSGCSSILTIGIIWSGFELLVDLVLYIANYIIGLTPSLNNSLQLLYMCQLHTPKLLWWCHRSKYTEKKYFLLWLVFLTYYLLLTYSLLSKKNFFLARFPRKIWSGWTRHPAEAGFSPKRQETKKKKSWGPHRRWTCKEKKKEEDKWRRWTQKRQGEKYCWQHIWMPLVVMDFSCSAEKSRF